MDCVEEQYAKNAKLRKEDVQLLQKWLESQPHLPRMTEYEIICFLHSCFFNNELAKKAIDNYFTMRTISPEILKLDDEKSRTNFNTVLDSILFTNLPENSSEGYRVYIGHMKDDDVSKYIFNSIVKIWDTVITVDVMENGPQEGILLVLDCKGFSFAHLSKIGVTSLKKLLLYLQDAAPVRLKGIYFFNVSSILDKLLVMMKPFLKKEVADSLRLFPKFEDMKGIIPLSGFPKDLGGDNESVEVLQEQLKQKIRKYEDYLKELDSRMVDETKRPGKPKGELDGVEGTFKKINID